MKVRPLFTFLLSLVVMASFARDVMGACGSRTKSYSNNQHDLIMSYVAGGNSAEALGDAAALRAQDIQAANHCEVPTSGASLTASPDGPSCINAASYNQQGELAATNLTEAVRQYDICINKMQQGWAVASARVGDIGSYESRPPEPICASMVDSAANKATRRMEEDRNIAASEKAACELKKAQTLTMIDATRTVAKHGVGEQTGSVTGTVTGIAIGVITEPPITGGGGSGGGGGEDEGDLAPTNNLAGRSTNGSNDGDGGGSSLEPDLITANGGRSLSGDAGGDKKLTLNLSANGQACAMKAADGRCLTAEEVAAMMGGADRGGSGGDAEGADGRSGMIVRNTLTVTDKEGNPLRLFPLATMAYQGCANDVAERGCQLRRLAEAEAGRRRQIVMRAPASRPIPSSPVR